MSFVPARIRVFRESVLDDRTGSVYVVLLVSDEYEV